MTDLIDAGAVATYDQLVSAYRSLEPAAEKAIGTFRAAKAKAAAAKAEAVAAKNARDKAFEAADKYWRDRWFTPVANAALQEARPERALPADFPKEA